MAKIPYRLAVNFYSGRFKTLLGYLHPEQGDKILDIGCHRGFYVKEFEKYTKGITGIDIDNDAICKAVTKKVKCGDALDICFKANTFDKVYSLHTVEHIKDSKKFFKEAARVLKKGGIAVIVYPWEPIWGIQATFPAIAMYGNPFKARKIHVHKFTPEKVKAIIVGTGFSYVKSRLVFTLNPMSLQYFTILKKV